MCGRLLALTGFLALVGPSCTNSDNLALLLDTLKPVHRIVCDEDFVSLACPTGTAISILVAQYGDDPPKDDSCIIDDVGTQVKCKLPNKMQYMLLQRVVEVCQKKPNCIFSTKTKFSPGEEDPCPKSRKYVEVSYKCRPFEFRSLNVCDDQVVRLSCNPNSRIAIYDVVYGRMAYEVVTCPQPQGVPDETCGAPYAVETVMRMCHGKRRCQFVTNRRTFNATCKPNSRPYVKVIYACVPLGVLISKYEAVAEIDETDGGPVTGNTFDETNNAGEKWRETNLFSPIADPALQLPETTTLSSVKPDDLRKTTGNGGKDQGTSLKNIIYIGAGILLVIVLVLIIIGIRCYFVEKSKENAKNGNMFTTEAPNVFNDTISELDNDVEVSHISGTFYDPVHPDMILYRDADGTRNTLRAMKPLSTIYPCAGARMYGNADYVPQPRELGRFSRSKSNEEEGDPTSPKSIGAYSTSRFYYG